MKADPSYQVRLKELDMKAAFSQFWNDEDGITALEYGLIAGIVAVALIAAVGTFSDGLKTLFEDLASKLTSSTTSGG